jgi:hypothetical protein
MRENVLPQVHNYKLDSESSRVVLKMCLLKLPFAAIFVVYPMTAVANVSVVVALPWLSPPSRCVLAYSFSRCLGLAPNLLPLARLKHPELNSQRYARCKRVELLLKQVTENPDSKQAKWCTAVAAGSHLVGKADLGEFSSASSVFLLRPCVVSF